MTGPLLEKQRDHSTCRTERLSLPVGLIGWAGGIATDCYQFVKI